MMLATSVYYYTRVVTLAIVTANPDEGAKKQWEFLTGLRCRAVTSGAQSP